MASGMTSFPQLRVRTEFSFRQGFGPVPAVAAALQGLGCGAAAMVDGGTWGHAAWAKHLNKAGIKPLFGTELVLPREDGRKPVAWALAEDARKFYNFSTAAQQSGADLHALFRESKGIIRFAGAALSDPDCYDYIDLNPASPLQQRAALELHKRTKKPLVITSDNAYPTREDYYAFMAISGKERVTPQHLLTMQELRAWLPTLTASQFKRAVSNVHEVAERCTSTLPQAKLIQFDGDLTAMAQEGKAMRLALGHIADWTDEYEARMQRELVMIAQKKYESYFLVVADLIIWSKQRMLVGPGRGSSAGSLVCYLLRITEVDPLPHGLLFERFIDVSRNDLPDIDIDFSDSKREQCFTYLADKYGHDKVARIGSINNLRAKSVIAKVVDRLGIPEREKYDVLNVLIEYSSGDSRYGHSLEDTMTQTEPGKKFIAAHPEAAVMFRLENHASHTGVHAAGVIVCNEPISDFCTVGAEGVAQIDKPYAEAINLLKIDALGLRTLGVIEDAGVVTADELYALKLDDQKVFDLFNSRRYAGIFQFEGQAQRRVSAEVHIDSFRRIDHVTALARPGPLGGGASQKYIARAAGREEVSFRHPSMETYLGPTMGVVLYQEQVMRICFEIGQFSWETVSEIRKAMSGRKGKEYFDKRGDEFVVGALRGGVSEEDARVIWAEICTFGAWGMNASHTTSYGIISYWCAWMKTYHGLAYAAACLRNVKDEEQAYELLRDMNSEGIEYTSFDVETSDVDWAVVNRRLVGGFMNLEGYGPAKANAAVLARAAGKLDREKIAKAPVRFQELYPLSAAYGRIYANPELHGCRAGSTVSRLDNLPPSGEVLMIVKVMRKELRDENETVRVARRDGKRLSGPTLFVDVFVSDDSGTPLTLRFDRFAFEPMGRLASERLEPGDALLVRGKRIPNFAMVKVDKMKCLNREVNFDA
ncbi:DnaE DNA polymerase III, alpha subunit [uncultured Caudovirales phage]|uniref:DnaE DNA polymerase III, alpha subunit n=1 Tax=uncultured Caudovirales phage TaxID=2100421 RepID=A0A6J5NZ98_9CAUD|nr:DnaE DNA polymerase III, alpha subunit [uncultured Caudovirales phage]